MYDSETYVFIYFLSLFKYCRAHNNCSSHASVSAILESSKPINLRSSRLCLPQPKASPRAGDSCRAAFPPTCQHSLIHRRERERGKFMPSATHRSSSVVLPDNAISSLHSQPQSCSELPHTFIYHRHLHKAGLSYCVLPTYCKDAASKHNRVNKEENTNPRNKKSFSLLRNKEPQSPQ